MSASVSRRSFLKGLGAAGTGSLWLKPALVAEIRKEGALHSNSLIPAEWPMLKRNPQHTGYTEARLVPPFKPVWAREFTGERMGTAVEPVLADQKLFAPTHAGNLYALDAVSGEGRWRFQVNGPILHSPAIAKDVVVFGSADGYLYGCSPTGKMLWRLQGGYGGFSASPLIHGESVFLGTRSGDFLAATVEGKLRWRVRVDAPIRQTAAAFQQRIYVTGEDLIVRCFEAETGKLVWRSPQLPGQTARDYYPMVVKAGARVFVIVRTNPILNMGQRIGRDRTMLCRNAGIDDSSWQKLETWIKSADARGNPELWAKEQQAIREHLSHEPDARTFFVLDAENGKEAFIAPVLWIGGCQGIGAMPALTGDGRLVVFYRSAYGNWNHGVAPLVALGLFDLDKNQITPLFHQQGAQPQWNCFWGTADESQNFLVAGETVIIVHQGTLSGFNLKTNELFPIWGGRDTFGGFRNPPWARNEWHGPARSGVAVVGDRIYWQSGSRVLCIEMADERKDTTEVHPSAISKEIPSFTTPIPESPSRAQARSWLNETAEAVLNANWAPLFTDPGLAGRVFSFQHSGELFEALAAAFPHLDSKLQKTVKERLAKEWNDHPPYSAAGAYSLTAGQRREWFKVDPQYCARLGNDRQPHPFGYVSAVARFAERCQEWDRVVQGWPGIKTAYEDFRKTGWQLKAEKGDSFANRYASSLLAVQSLASKCNDSAVAADVSGAIEQTTKNLLAWWERTAKAGTLETFSSSSELDAFIGQGDDLFFSVAPHRHKLALFQDLTPEIAVCVSKNAPASVAQVWQTFEALCPTWHLMGEERQVHFGENFMDPPELALSAFRAMAWLTQASFEQLARRLDLPFCRADLYYLTKLSIALDT